jgi:predicted PurR-regulated permease PerM
MAFVGLVLFQLIPPLVQEAGNLSRDLPGYIASLDERSKTFRELSREYGFDKTLNDIAQDLPKRVGTSALGFFSRFLGVLASTLLVTVLAIYFMADLPRIRHLIPRAFPAAMRERADRVVDVVFDKVGSYMIGGLAVSFIASTVAFIALTVLKVPFALPLALVVFLCAFIPQIGATLGSAICVIVAAIANGIWPTAVLVLIVFVVYQQLELSHRAAGVPEDGEPARRRRPARRAHRRHAFGLIRRADMIPSDRDQGAHGRAARDLREGASSGRAEGADDHQP